MKNGERKTERKYKRREEEIIARIGRKEKEKKKGNKDKRKLDRK